MRLPRRRIRPPRGSCACGGVAFSGRRTRAVTAARPPATKVGAGRAAQRRDEQSRADQAGDRGRQVARPAGPSSSTSGAPSANDSDMAPITTASSARRHPRAKVIGRPPLDQVLRGDGAEGVEQPGREHAEQHRPEHRRQADHGEAEGDRHAAADHRPAARGCAGCGGRSARRSRRRRPRRRRSARSRSSRRRTARPARPRPRSPGRPAIITIVQAIVSSRSQGSRIRRR